MDLMSSKWKFDGNEILVKNGARIEWHDRKFFTILNQGKRFNGEVCSDNSEQNELMLKINHRVFHLKKMGELDELIASLGLDKPKIKKLKEVQAPMPGRILDVKIEIGQDLQVGDDILSLEAMKMENVLKADGFGKVKEILIQPNQVVEKGSTLIVFE
jgi:biotin carboxyl carrier protein